MATKFSDFVAELKREAEGQGPEAVAELKYFRERYRLARRFAEARRKRGWTQKKLAEKTGLNQSEISTLESGQANPTYKTLQTLACGHGGRNWGGGVRGAARGDGAEAGGSPSPPRW